MNVAVFTTSNPKSIQFLKNLQSKRDFSLKLVVTTKKDVCLKGVNNHKYEDDDTLVDVLRTFDVSVVLLLGYHKLVSKKIIGEFRVYNVHHSLLPKHAGKGMYGLRVHKKVLESDDELTGVTLHRVETETYDEGEILLQEQVKIAKGATPKTLFDESVRLESSVLEKALKKGIL